MNYGIIKNQIATIIKSMGLPVKIQHHSGSTSSVYGVFSETKAKNMMERRDPIYVTETDRTIYITNPKTKPEIGDQLIVNKIEYNIKEVVRYEPTNITIAYKLLVNN